MLQSDIRLKIEGYVEVFASKEQIACLPEKNIHSVRQWKADVILLAFITWKEHVSSSHGDSILAMSKSLGNLGHERFFSINLTLEYGKLYVFYMSSVLVI